MDTRKLYSNPPFSHIGCGVGSERYAKKLLEGIQASAGCSTSSPISYQTIIPRIYFAFALSLALAAALQLQAIYHIQKSMKRKCTRIISSAGTYNTPPPRYSLMHEISESWALSGLLRSFIRKFVSDAFYWTMLLYAFYTQVNFYPLSVSVTVRPLLADYWGWTFLSFRVGNNFWIIARLLGPFFVLVCVL